MISPNQVQALVHKAFGTVKAYTKNVTFRMGYVYSFAAAADTETETPSYTKTVPAIQWRDMTTRNPGGATYMEMVVVEQWDDVPAPTFKDRMVNPDGVVQQIQSVDGDPSDSVWIITLKGPTKQ